MLKAQDLHKFYKEGSKEVRALKGIDLEVEKGEILGIVGPSGAGKSTLLHLLGGLDMPTRGTVFLDGTDLYKISDNARCRIRNRRVGFVFQFYHLLPGFTALENVMMPAMIGGSKRIKAKERARSLLEAVGLNHRIEHKPAELSGGEAQRVAIARSLMNHPDIVFCDEPTGNLDSKMSADVYDLILRLSRDNKQTFVIATHQEEFAKKAGRVLHIRDGQFQTRAV
ncbi:MAG: ABC transporter ATP-binding protein [Candidatus Omnitrophica bacterium]|nr:ABC transporter ATP-binding protein [Candidatus Omnitrophota bacterium]